MTSDANQHTGPADGDAPSFDKDFWEEHWEDPERGGAAAPANPYVVAETRGLSPGRALDAGCGTGTEALALAATGWDVTGVDLSERAIATARERAAAGGAAGLTHWIAADLTAWEPEQPLDLVMTNYAHASIPQLDLYRRIAEWVAPGGTLLIVGHLDHGGHGHDDAGHRHGEHSEEHDGDWPPAEATVTGDRIAGVLDPALWRIETVAEHTRTLPGYDGERTLRDVVVRATRHVGD
ncbi:class I SAM-dependent methyltransferase [Zhihengliuella halotolerans]|uniref:class I SAM-dependent methyltransferase n=1 Tax=Zhihengliuella halotolerans TaxID=370736 RepID=UPI000C80AD95|nr:class I SAM-dependent methyltransferase [Zhihengliuella halotolerans]